MQTSAALGPLRIRYTDAGVADAIITAEGDVLIDLEGIEDVADAVHSARGTYPATDADNRSGTGDNIWLQRLLYNRNLPRGFVLAQTSGIEVTAPNNTTWTTADNGSGALRLNAGAGHGLTNASDGRYLQCSGTAGLPTGLYRMTYVDADSLDFTDVLYTTQITGPDIVAVNETITLLSVTVPAGVMGRHGAVDYELSWQSSNNATAKFSRVLFGGVAAAADITYGTGVVVAEQRLRVANQALGGLLDAVQRCNSCVTLAASVSSAVVALTADTRSDVASLVQAQVTAAGEWIRLAHGRVVLFSSGGG